MSDLKIALLGAPEVDYLNHRLLFPDRKTLALLAYLATEEGMHKRQKLTSLLWPESDRAHGRTALRVALHHLRRLLEEEKCPEHKTFLLITRDALGLNTASNIDLDLHTLEAAWKLVQKLPAGETMQGEVRRTMISQLQHAATLCRGGFLEGWTLRDTIDFDNWVGIQRAYWYHRIERVFDCLSQLQAIEGTVEQAIETVERWRSFDPLNEDIYLRLMQLHLTTGNRIEALKSYKTCVDILRTELSAKPSQKLVALAESIRNASLSHRMKSHTSGEQHTSSVQSLLNIPFVGRAAEFSRLMSLYEQAAGGLPQIVLIEGEAGIGKSRLAAAFLDWAKVQGIEMFTGRAYKISKNLSYQPLLDSLRIIVRQRQDLSLLLSEIWLAELSRLLPELRERYPDLPQPTADETFASSRFFEALARLSQAFAAQAPLLLFIDDIQWADEATLDALHYIVRRWTECATPALLLLVRRSETRSMDVWLAEGLANLKNTASLTRLELAPLSAKDIRQMVQSFSDTEKTQAVAQRGRPFSSIRSLSQSATGNTLSSERFGEWLFAETGGQPFYTVAVLEALLEHGDLVPRLIEGKRWVFDPQSTIFHADAFGGLLPSNVREMILGRLTRLSPTARELLAAGAVLDHDFSFEALCHIAHLSTQDGLSALDEAIESLLLRESPRKAGKASSTTYVFAHDKIREVVYGEAGDARRRVFHGRALHILEQAGSPAAEMAYHALASGSADAAFHWSAVAGDEAMKVFAIRDAIGHYEQARQLIAEHGIQAPPKTLAHLFAQLGRAYEHRNDPGAAQATYQAMLETARKMQDTAMECFAFNYLAVLVSENFSQLEQAMKLLQDVLDIADRTNDQVVLAQTHLSLARIHYYVLNLETSLVHARLACALARELEQQDLITKSLNILAYTTRALGQWEDAAAIAEEARQLSVARGDRMMEADCLSRIADAQINCGRPHEGVAAARLAYTISLEIEHSWGQANSGYQLARGLVEIGAYEEALLIAQQSTEVARTVTLNILFFVNLVTLGMVYQALLLPEEALRAHLEALEISKMIPSQRYVGLSSSLLCVDYALAGDWEAASRYAWQGLATRDPTVVVCPEVPRWPETEALVRAGGYEQAAEILHAFYERFGTNRRCHLTYIRAQAALAQTRGEHERARICLQEAIAEAQEIGLPGELWQAEAALGELLLVCEEHEQAVQAFARAATIVEKLARDITSNELRSRFLASPQVQRILAHKK